MTSVGVFRDDFYNAFSVLTQSQITATAFTANATLVATVLAGASDVYVQNATGSANSPTLTTDTAVNIIAQLQTAVAAAYKANIAGSGANVSPPPGVPNLFNLTYTLTISNTGTTSGSITLAGGTGVTIAGTATILFGTSRTFVVSVTSPTTVTITNCMSGTT